MNESEQEERQRHHRGRVAFRLIVLCVAVYDVVFLVGAITSPTWWRLAILVALLISQAGAVDRRFLDA